MPPKGKKKDPNAPLDIPEDTFVRGMKLRDLKVAMKQPKGEFTSEEWCIPPIFHKEPEFKNVIHYFTQCGIVSYNEHDLKVPTRLKWVEDEGKAPRKPHPRKEIQDMFKYFKGQVKQATKRTGQFLKQLEKKEGKEVKRQTLLAQIGELDSQMNEDLRNSRGFADVQLLFDKRYMIGTKLGDKAPRKNALIAVELSDKQAVWVDETKDEITKLLNGVINESECDTFNLCLFSGSAQQVWCPQFQSKADPKKGLADALKWLNKNFSPKTCGASSFPPDWDSMIKKFTGEGATPPWRMYVCCSRAPEDKGVKDEVLSLRESMDPPARNEPILPINIVAFDPYVVDNEEEKAFFDELAGPDGSYMSDTSQQDLQNLDKMLKNVGANKKKLDKMSKKLEKMEDLSERVAEDRALFQTQMALQRML
eukprot:CAMPEP_0195108794 /NCGR_PEP_ID=MMETSP0448-20130528/86710_1 /TAXON_ID=66468 /ORGANISM="Heterocapsa triquestra, Strain CCMP 448" /LENGTH=420 /DNA_ID=CAMNT_0040145363 /DNA_START=30 /DNA_END=1289 /DNA_ORIENTATION=-